MHVPAPDGPAIAAAFAARDWVAAGSWTVTRGRDGTSHFDSNCRDIGGRYEVRDVPYLGPHNIFLRKHRCQAATCQSAYQHAVMYAVLTQRAHEAYRTAGKLDALATTGPLDEPALTELCSSAYRLKTFLAVVQSPYRYFADLLVAGWRAALPSLIERSSRSAAVQLARQAGPHGEPVDEALVDEWVAAAGDVRVPLTLRRNQLGLTLPDHLHRLGVNLDELRVNEAVAAPILVAVCRSRNGRPAGPRVKPVAVTVPACATSTERLLLVLLGERPIHGPSGLVELLEVAAAVTGPPASEP